VPNLTSSDPTPMRPFLSWHAGVNFAFARGLAISPVHLPLALDDMLSQGYELITCFGKPETTEIGFLFRRIK